MAEPAIRVETIEELRNLGEDWDTYGGRPPTYDALNVVERGVFVVPLPNGGVQVELILNDCEIEIGIGPSGFLSGLTIDHDA